MCKTVGAPLFSPCLLSARRRPTVHFIIYIKGLPVPRIFNPFSFPEVLCQPLYLVFLARRMRVRVLQPPNSQTCSKSSKTCLLCPQMFSPNKSLGTRFQRALRLQRKVACGGGSATCVLVGLASPAGVPDHEPLGGEDTRVDVRLCEPPRPRATRTHGELSPLALGTISNIYHLLTTLT